MYTRSFRLAAALLLSGITSSAALSQAEAEPKPEPVVVKPVVERPESETTRIREAMKASKKAEIDKTAPDFKLVDAQGREHKLSDYVAAGYVVVLEWFNPQCPYVVEHYNSEGKGTSTAVEKEFQDQGLKVVWLRVNSGSAESRTSGKDYNNQVAKEWKITSPILMDLDGKVGRSYGAKVTPTMYVITADGTIAYEGMLDSEQSPSKTGEIIYPREAVKSVLANETVETKQTKAVGCGVKYAKKSND